MPEQKPTTRRLHFLLDEMPTLGYAPELAFYLSEEARSKGVCVWQGYQTLTQAQALYGNLGIQRVLNSGFTKLIFNAGDELTAKAISDFCGEIEIEQTKTSHTSGQENEHSRKSVTKQTLTRKLLLPSQITGMREFHFYYLVQEFVALCPNAQWDSIVKQTMPYPNQLELPFFDTFQNSNETPKKSVSPVILDDVHEKDVVKTHELKVATIEQNNHEFIF